jgi:hypothetical protein
LFRAGAGIVRIGHDPDLEDNPGPVVSGYPDQIEKAGYSRCGVCTDGALMQQVVEKVLERKLRIFFVIASCAATDPADRSPSRGEANPGTSPSRHSFRNVSRTV